MRIWSYNGHVPRAKDDIVRKVRKEDIDKNGDYIGPMTAKEANGELVRRPFDCDHRPTAAVVDDDDDDDVSAL
ncbi:unnamed protein product [Heligmosomoides polygyrus]|uniref:Hva1_TUDOR domain-containing protein n=1 Tax=Heligmosomoides polygyrus TaxID=6339 RepID=A0A3P8A073_HELPZ|nr:unnamed protein product [Heligmosomoides polygyrus]